MRKIVILICVALAACAGAPATRGPRGIDRVLLMTGPDPNSILVPCSGPVVPMLGAVPAIINMMFACGGAESDFNQRRVAASGLSNRLADRLARTLRDRGVHVDVLPHGGRDKRNTYGLFDSYPANNQPYDVIVDCAAYAALLDRDGHDGTQRLYAPRIRAAVRIVDGKTGKVVATRLFTADDDDATVAGRSIPMATLQSDPAGARSAMMQHADALGALAAGMVRAD